MWCYRVSRQTLDNSDVVYAIREFYDKETSWTEDEITPCGESLESLKWTLQKMLEACDEPVIEIGES